MQEVNSQDIGAASQTASGSPASGSPAIADDDAGARLFFRNDTRDNDANAQARLSTATARDVDFFDLDVNDTTGASADAGVLPQVAAASLAWRSH
jgi:hypothetical protein